MFVLKTSVYIGTSLDGFIARKNGDIDWLTKFEDPEVFKSFDEFINSIDAIVIGRGTFEKVLTFPFWPYTKKVFVLSNSIQQLPEKLTDKVTVISMHPLELLKFLSGEGFNNIYIDGGNVIQSFLKEDCIDEMIITKVPVLIGNGISLFGDLKKDIFFKLVKSKVFSSGLVMCHYERKQTQ
jgi:dihydrofolate reductase